MSRFRTVWGKQGPPGTGLTSGEKTTINSRLTALEGDIGDIPDSIGDMTDVDLSSIASGDLLQWDGSKLVKASPIITVPFTIPAVVDGGSSAPTAGMKATIRANFACTVTNWYIANDVSGNVEWDIRVGGSSIVGTEKMRTVGAKSASSTTMAGWNTSIAALDAMEIWIISASGITQSSLNLYLTRTITLGS